MALSAEGRVKIINLFYLNGKSITLTRRAARTQLNIVISEDVIRGIVKKFQNYGSVVKSGKKSPGRPKSARTQQAVKKVQGSVLLDPKLSHRRRALQLDISRTTTQRILKKDLGHKAYRITIVQQLLPPDYKLRVDFCERMLTMVAEDPTILEKLMFTDEAKYHTDGTVSKNCNICYYFYIAKIKLFYINKRFLP